MADQLNRSLTAMDWLSNLSFAINGPLDQPQGIMSCNLLSSGDSDIHILEEISDPEVKSSQMQLNVDGKPSYSYAHLITSAILSSKDNRMTLSEIYQWISDNFAYYRDIGNGWKNSVRHNLSLSKSFVKIPRPRSDPGKGSYWTLAENVIDPRPFQIGECQKPLDHNESSEHLSKQANCNDDSFAYSVYEMDSEANYNSHLQPVSPVCNVESPLLYTAHTIVNSLDVSRSISKINTREDKAFDSSENLNLSNSFRRLYDEICLETPNELAFSLNSSNALPSITSCIKSLKRQTNIDTYSHNSNHAPPTPSTLPASDQTCLSLKVSIDQDNDEEQVVLDDEDPAEAAVTEYLTEASARVHSEDESLWQVERVKTSLKEALATAVSFDWSQVDMSEFSELSRCMRNTESITRLGDSLSLSQLWQLDTSLHKALSSLKQRNFMPEYRLNKHQNDISYPQIGCNNSQIPKSSVASIISMQIKSDSSFPMIINGDLVPQVQSNRCSSTKDQMMLATNLGPSYILSSACYQHSN